MRDINSSDAQLIINSLQCGTIPLEYADFYNVGRAQEIALIQKEIEALRADRLRLKFVRGDYGQGKTQLLGVLRAWSIQNGYAATHVVLQSRGISLANLRAVYGTIIKNMWRPDHSHPAIQAILEVILARYQAWKGTIDLRRLRCQQTDISLLFCHHCYEKGIVEQQYLPGFDELDPLFRRAISLYRRSSEGFSPDGATRELIVRFFEDDLGYRRAINFVGLWDPLSPEQILSGIAQVANIVKLVGLRGFVIALDEAEAISSIGGQGVLRGYENLAALVRAARSCANVYFIYATTPTFFDDIHRFAPELADLVSDDTRVDLTPLGEDELLALGERVIHLLRLTGWCPSEREGVGTLVKQVAGQNRSMVGGSVRNFLQTLFAVLAPF